MSRSIRRRRRHKSRRARRRTPVLSSSLMRITSIAPKSLEEIVSQHADKIRAGIYILNPEGAASLAESLGESLTHEPPGDVGVKVVDGVVEFTSKKAVNGWVAEGEVFKKRITPTRCLHPVGW